MTGAGPGGAGVGGGGACAAASPAVSAQEGKKNGEKRSPGAHEMG